MRPEKPANAIDNRPAATKRTGVPFTKAGILASLILSRIPAMRTIAIIKPAALPNEYTIDSVNE